MICMRIFRNHLAWFIGIVVAWTLLLAFMLSGNLNDHRESVITFAKSEADVLIQHIKAARAWNAKHGGLYVETNEHTPPNPYLEGLVKERDITTPSGRKLTIVNPAYMTRLINEQFNEDDKRVAHITSLNPLRPENAADQWESAALRSFDEGAAEASEITDINGKSYMRLMRPLITQQACLQCHASQGYKLGDIRGGITASVPFEKHAIYLQTLNFNDTATYGLIWLLGLAGLSLGYRQLKYGAIKLQQAEKDIHILSASVEQASEAIIITSSDGFTEYINPAFTRLTGYEWDEIIGKKASLLKSGTHDKQFFADMWQNISTGTNWQNRVVNRKKDGSYYPAMLSIAPIKNEDGDITHYVGSQQDLSEYEGLEDQFHQAQKMEALGTLVGGIAHDFNNTLAGIIGNLYLAKKSVTDDPKTLQRLQTIEDLSNSAAGMIQQLLSYAREDMKSMNPMAIAPFLKEAIKIHEVSVPENIKLAMQIKESDLYIKGDINQLQQVIMNLINNARDAVQNADEPTITVKLESFEADTQFISKHPEVSARQFACISVSDNGTGINIEDIEHIFEPFFSTKEIGKGTGLGLSMVYGAVKSHAGVIDVESRPGKGTTFHLWLPLMDPSQIAVITTPDEEIVEGKGETILLVDDDASVIETGKAVLEELGYRVLIATDGIKAEDTFRIHCHDIDLVILDVVMPRRSGVDAAEAIRKINPDMKIIFATGYDRSNTLRGKTQIQAETIITKPYSTGKISQLIRSVLEA